MSHNPDEDRAIWLADMAAGQRRLSEIVGKMHEALTPKERELLARRLKPTALPQPVEKR